MKIAVQTSLPAFQNDIGDVVRLFYGEGAAVEETQQADARLTHIHEEADGEWCETFVLTDCSGRTEQNTLSAPAVFGGLEEKRQKKRLIKRCCYMLLKRLSGRQPAWGSLTGIRPTRLYYQQLENGKTRGEARHTLQDLFDLSQEKIDLLDEILDAQQGLMDRRARTCDVYIGIPFCTTRCAYCSFSSGEIGDGRLVEPYLAALLHEIEACAEMAREMGLHIRVGYIGGGTPSSLTTPQLDRLLAHVERHFGALAEFTVEAGRPDTLDAQKLRMLRDHPVTRISINPQTMNDETLRTIGRAHNAAQVKEAFAMARQAGFDNINMDLIAGLPGEDLHAMKHTLEEIRALAPESLTVHSLAIKRAANLNQQMDDYKSTIHHDMDAMHTAAQETAQALGMEPYYLYRQKNIGGNLENVGYAKPGCECLYNILIMEEMTDIIAAGAGASTKLVYHAENRVERVENCKSVDDYISRFDEMLDRKRKAF